MCASKRVNLCMYVYVVYVYVCVDEYVCVDVRLYVCARACICACVCSTSRRRLPQDCLNILEACSEHVCVSFEVCFTTRVQNLKFQAENKISFLRRNKTTVGLYIAHSKIVGALFLLYISFPMILTSFLNVERDLFCCCTRLHAL